LLAIASAQVPLADRIPRGGDGSALPSDDDDDDAGGGGGGDPNRGALGPQLLATATIVETTTTTVLEDGDEEPNRSGVDEPDASAGLADQTEPLFPRSEGEGSGADVPDAATASPPPPRSSSSSSSYSSPVDENQEVDGEEDEGEDETAASLRRRAKELHDAGMYREAAELFRRASRRIERSTSSSGVYAAEEDEKDAEEYATCRLHEALCRLKAGGPDQAGGAAEACRSVLDRKSGLPNVLVARAFHRRAKANVELGRLDDALDDARSAAFLGDRKAVALYGKLMREHSGEHGGAPPGGSDGSPPDSSSLLDLLMSAGTGGGASPSFASPLDSLSRGGLPSLFPSLSNLGVDGSDGGSLAKSVLSSLSKKLQDDSTQDSICTFLQQTSPLQLRSLAGMAGFPLAERQADRLAQFCRGITPRTLQGWIRTSQRVASGVRLVRKLFRLLAKYRSLLIVVCVLAWTKSAILRPIPLPRSARRG
jgi:hypothetical protein